MKRQGLCVLAVVFIWMSWTVAAFALEERGITVIYKVTHITLAGQLTTYVRYSVAAYQKTGHWLQRTTSMKIDSRPLSITQTFLGDYDYEPLRYIMYRPAKMNRPPSVIDLPLDQMGQDEVLPLPIEEVLGEVVSVQTEAGTFETKQVRHKNALLWLTLDIPVLGVAKAETEEWGMEFIRIDDTAKDLLPKKPPPGGVVYLKE